MAGAPQGQGKLRRERIVLYVQTFIATFGFPPSIGDMIRDLEIPESSLRWHLNSLRDQGFLQWIDGRMARSLTAPERDLSRLE